MIKLAGLFPHNLTDKLKKACEQAAFAHEVPVAAACLHPKLDKAVITFNEVEQIQSGLAHAECLALEAMQKILRTRYLTDAILVSTLEPCTMCMGAIAQFRVSGLLYFVSDDKAGYFSKHGIAVSDQMPMRISLGTHQMWVRSVPELGKPFANYLSTFFQQLRSFSKKDEDCHYFINQKVAPKTYQ